MVRATMLSTIVLRAQPDARLTRLAGEGSEAAFEAIVQRYRRDLLAYCSRLLLADSRAEDAVQQALLAAWTALRSGTEVLQLKPWLYRITHNHAMSALRRPGWDFVELSDSLCGRDAPESDLERRVLMRETLAAVAALPSAQRQAILRTAVEGQSYAAAADAMGVSDTALRGLVHRARVNLRSAVAAVAPTPLVLWAAGISRRHAGALGWLSDTLATSGGTGATVGAGAVVVKSAVVLASSAAIVGGGLAAQGSLPALHTSHRHVTSHRAARLPKAHAVETTAASASGRPLASPTQNNLTLPTTDPNTRAQRAATANATAIGGSIAETRDVYRQAEFKTQDRTSPSRVSAPHGRFAPSDAQTRQSDRAPQSGMHAARQGSLRATGRPAHGADRTPDPTVPRDSDRASVDSEDAPTRGASSRFDSGVPSASHGPASEGSRTTENDEAATGTSHNSTAMTGDSAAPSGTTHTNDSADRKPAVIPTPGSNGSLGASAAPPDAAAAG